MTTVSLNALQRHQIYRLTNDLASFLGIERDYIAFVELISLAAGRMAIPINLDIVSDQSAVDLAIADRIATIVPGKTVPIDTYKSFLAEEKQNFTDRYVLWFRRNYPRMHQDLVAFMARATDSLDSAPSIWRICPSFVEPSTDIPTLRLIACLAERKLGGFAASFASAVGSQIHRQRLLEVIETLCPRTNYRFAFRDRLTGTLSPSSMLIVERLLQVFTNVRRVLTEFKSSGFVTLDDYEAVRTLLVNLPLVPMDRVISASTIKTAEIIYAHVYADDYQLALPDRSGEGHHWFTRNHTVEWTQLGYTTAKKHLDELVDDGLVVASVDRNNREHGRIIHYRFADGRAPPFGWSNPFEALPAIGIN
jgi:hypothetical protein